MSVLFQQDYTALVEYCCEDLVEGEHGTSAQEPIKLPILFSNFNNVPVPTLLDPIDTGLKKDAVYNGCANRQLGKPKIEKFYRIIPDSEASNQEKSIFLAKTTVLSKSVTEIRRISLSEIDKMSNQTEREFCRTFRDKHTYRTNEDSKEMNDASKNEEILTKALKPIGTVISNKSSDLHFQMDKPLDENIEILKDYEYSISYLPSKGPRRRRRILHCKHNHCKKSFYKTWNFIDHARMHLGIKPYSCDLCDAKFTQKGNLLKHIARHDN
ncbi:unnamed protein product [Moneuplotes crassus]|uniref:C2H2-type domain-containing protein n=1 Tax=Euplotes crassus TaxID=5936 RepID=A0AAD1XKN0_EUPCR|nr:unnamed protein product [Moneuplotes crassus]